MVLTVLMMKEVTTAQVQPSSEVPTQKTDESYSDLVASHALQAKDPVGEEAVLLHFGLLGPTQISTSKCSFLDLLRLSQLSPVMVLAAPELLYELSTICHQPLNTSNAPTANWVSKP